MAEFIIVPRPRAETNITHTEGARWFKKWVLFSCFSIGRKSQKMNETVKGLSEGAYSIGNKVADQRPVQDPVPGDLECSVEFESSFGSRITTANQIIQALKDDNITLLGVHGMPGVGKTTLISALATYMKKQKIFDEVVVVTLSQTPDKKTIQDEIAMRLDLMLQDDNILAIRAVRLFRRLSQPKKTLIVLDNVWQKVQFAEVGIPEGLKNCKVVFTTRDEDVCNVMDTQGRIEVTLLSQEESWQLFRQKAGDAIDSLAFETIAGEIVNKCQGLPLALVTFGRELYGKHRSYWNTALRDLQNSIYLQNSTFTGGEVLLTSIKFSYNSMRTKEHQLCFLFFCLFPSGYHINMDQLFCYMNAEKLLPHIATLEERRARLRTITDNLKSSSLLSYTESGCILMHDIVRDMAMYIASDPKEGHGFIVKHGMTSRDYWPEVELYECRHLSFISTTRHHMSWSLPSKVEAANLLTLSFHGNENLIEIPSDFFEGIRSLTTLDLSYTGINALPPSIECLVKLCTLLLEGCPLKDFCLSNKLVKLEMLTLRYSRIERFSVTGKMTTLKMLDLSGAPVLNWIDENVISSFPKLEELYLLDIFRAGEPGGEEHRGKNCAEEDKPEGSGTERGGDFAHYLSEVTSLPRLTSLEFHVRNLECLSQNIPNWEYLTRFKIASGEIEDFSPFGVDDGLQMERSMYIEIRSKQVANWVKVLLRRTNFLQLKGSQSLSDLVELDASPEQRIFQELKVLMLSEIGSDISLIPCDLLVRLRSLNKLVVWNCNYLQKLIEFEVENKTVSTEASSSSRMNTFKISNLPASSVFPNLKYLRICECSQLKFLFPLRVVRLLSLLEMLYISNCPSMEIIIVHENAEDDGETGKEENILPKLKVLSLKGLTSLSQIIRQDFHLDFSGLEELSLNNCWRLKKLPFGSVPKITKVAAGNWFDVSWSGMTKAFM